MSGNILQSDEQLQFPQHKYFKSEILAFYPQEGYYGSKKINHLPNAQIELTKMQMSQGLAYHNYILIFFFSPWYGQKSHTPTWICYFRILCCYFYLFIYFLVKDPSVDLSNILSLWGKYGFKKTVSSFKTISSPEISAEKGDYKAVKFY